MNPWSLLAACFAGLFVIYVAYRIGKALLRLFIGLVVLGLLSWWLWTFFHS